MECRLRDGVLIGDELGHSLWGQLDLPMFAVCSGRWYQFLLFTGSRSACLRVGASGLKQYVLLCFAGETFAFVVPLPGSQLNLTSNSALSLVCQS